MRLELDRLPVVHRPPDERRFWRKLARVLAHVPFAQDLVTAWYCAKDPLTPGHVRAFLWGAVAYFLLPTDAIPDYVVALGYTDDAAVIGMVMSLLGRYVAPGHREAARDRLAALRRG